MIETGWAILAVLVAVLVAWLVERCWVLRRVKRAECISMGWSYANAELVKHAEGLQAELRAVRQSAEAILLERNALAKRLGRLERGVGGPPEGGLDSAFEARPGAEKYPFAAAAGLVAPAPWSDAASDRVAAALKGEPAPKREGPEISDVWPGYAEMVAADEQDAP